MISRTFVLTAVVSLCVAACEIAAAPLHKCTLNGTVTYQQDPCPAEQVRKSPTIQELNADEKRRRETAASAPVKRASPGAIKALSEEEVAGLLAGKGMGFAKAAELNGFAGPAHVLELASELQLNAEQRARTEALFAGMSAEAQATGRLLVDKEQALDRLFANRTVSPVQLASILREIGALQARVREAHLRAHLAQAEILTPEQSAKYASLRGYGESNGLAAHQHRQ